MAEWRKFAAKQKAKRRGKNQVVEESRVADEIVVQRMSADVSGKQQKYRRLVSPLGKAPVCCAGGLGFENADHHVTRWFKFQTKKCFTFGLLNQKGNLRKKRIVAAR